MHDVVMVVSFCSDAPSHTRVYLIPEHIFAKLSPPGPNWYFDLQEYEIQPGEEISETRGINGLVRIASIQAYDTCNFKGAIRTQGYPDS